MDTSKVNNSKTTYRYSTEYLLAQRGSQGSLSATERHAPLASIVPKEQPLSWRSWTASSSPSSGSSPSISPAVSRQPSQISLRSALHLLQNPDRLRTPPAFDALPYQIQYRYLTNLQQLTEQTLFDFCNKYLPQYMTDNYIDCWEAGEVNIYRPAITNAFEDLKERGVLKLSTGHQQRRTYRVASHVRDVDSMFRNLEKMRNIVVHRQNVGLAELRRHSDVVEGVLNLLGDETSVAKFSEFKTDMELKAAELGIKAEDRRASWGSFSSTDESSGSGVEDAERQ